MVTKKTDADPVLHPSAICYRGLLFGVELEIEAAGLYAHYFNEDGDEEIFPEAPKGWELMEEHSIEGPELASSGAYDYDTTVENIQRAFKDIRAQGFKPIRTCRGSTHIHINCQDLTWGQLRKTVTACAWAEQLLIERAGKGRKGNLFAMSYNTAPLGWADIIKSVRERNLRLHGDTHYMAINFGALTTHGTIEFRMPPSARNEDDAIDWLRCINYVALAGRADGDWLYSWSEEPYPLWLEPLVNAIPEARRDVFVAKARAQAETIAELMDRTTLVVPQPELKLNPCTDEYLDSLMTLMPTHGTLHQEMTPTVAQHQLLTSDPQLSHYTWNDFTSDGIWPSMVPTPNAIEPTSTEPTPQF